MVEQSRCETGSSEYGLIFYHEDSMSGMQRGLGCQGLHALILLARFFGCGL
uniref:Uncharacterized protein n=1 Tax=Candidatus Nitrotoga fabula TaxID=2182327 RepID=A0A2X0QY64_9PROT|nr:protein of unknown function [Candidatus Nitrotoga fabula]